jgi:hypothetical protein
VCSRTVAPADGWILRREHAALSSERAQADHQLKEDRVARGLVDQAVKPKIGGDEGLDVPVALRPEDAEDIPEGVQLGRLGPRSGGGRRVRLEGQPDLEQVMQRLGAARRGRTRAGRASCSPDSAVTYVPLPWRFSSTPMATSALAASRSVERETPRRSDSVPLGGQTLARHERAGCDEPLELLDRIGRHRTSLDLLERARHRPSTWQWSDDLSTAPSVC